MPLWIGSLNSREEWIDDKNGTLFCGRHTFGNFRKRERGEDIESEENYSHVNAQARVKSSTLETTDNCLSDTELLMLIRAMST